MTQVVILWSHSIAKEREDETSIYNITSISPDGDTIYLSAGGGKLVRHGLWWALRRRGKEKRGRYLPIIFGAFQDYVDVNYCRVEDRRFSRYCTNFLADGEMDSGLVFLLRLRLCLYHTLRYLAACAPRTEAAEEDIDFVRDLWSFLLEEQERTRLSLQQHIILDAMTERFLAWEEDEPRGIAALLKAISGLHFDILLDFAEEHDECLRGHRWLKSLFDGLHRRYDQMSKEELIYLLLFVQLNDYCYDLNSLFL